MDGKEFSLNYMCMLHKYGPNHEMGGKESQTINIEYMGAKPAFHSVPVYITGTSPK